MERSRGTSDRRDTSMAAEAPLMIKVSDLFRATLSNGCGNEGFIGVSGDGTRYHVVVPVDRQIARGLQAWVRPEDGTPFGGYDGWAYFPCLPYEGLPESPQEDRRARMEKARENGMLIRMMGEARGFAIRVLEDMD